MCTVLSVTLDLMLYLILTNNEQYIYYSIYYYLLTLVNKIYLLTPNVLLPAQKKV